jgi:hypothetical protein
MNRICIIQQNYSLFATLQQNINKIQTIKVENFAVDAESEEDRTDMRTDIDIPKTLSVKTEEHEVSLVFSYLFLFVSLCVCVCVCVRVRVHVHARTLSQHICLYNASYL